MNHPQITIPAGPLAGLAVRLLQQIKLLPRPHARARQHRGPRDLREAVENAFPAPVFGLPSPYDEACFELRGTSETVNLLCGIARGFPAEIQAECVVFVLDSGEITGVAVPRPVLCMLYREVTERQKNAVRALLAPGAVVYYPDFAAHERVRRMLAAALGLSVPNEPAVE